MPSGIYNHSKKRTGKFVNCIVCKTKFYVPKCYLKFKKCCSNKCRYESKEIRKKLSDARKKYLKEHPYTEKDKERFKKQFTNLPVLFFE